MIRSRIAAAAAALTVLLAGSTAAYGEEASSPAATSSATQACTGFTSQNVTVTDPWDTRIQIQVRGTMPDTSCVIALPRDARGSTGLDWAEGVWVFPSGAGEMRVADGRAEFVIYPEYAATHIAPFSVSGELAVGVERHLESRIAGDDVAIELPGVSVPIVLAYAECPECGAMPRESVKWATADINSGLVWSEVRLGADLIAAHPTVRVWTLSDRLTSPQQCRQAGLRIMREATGSQDEIVQAISCDDLTVTIENPEPDATYGLVLETHALKQDGPASDVGMIQGDGRVLEVFEVSAAWSDGGADGSGTTPSPTPAPTPDPSDTPTAEPTPDPSDAPTAEPTPTPDPSDEPTAEPTPTPTDTPAPGPTPSTPTDTPAPGPTPSTAPQPAPGPSDPDVGDRLPQLGTEASIWTAAGGLALLVTGGAVLAARRGI